MDLSTVRNRDRLAPQKEPYWQRLGTGRSLGFRVSKLGSGTWIARHYDSARKKNSSRSLGDFAELPPNRRFDEAKREAESWFASSPEAIPRRHATTVREACEEYAAIKPEAEGRFRRGIYSHPIADAPLEKLSRRQLADWVEQLSNRPALVSRSKKGPIRQRPRSPASINRDITAFRAALNRAFQLELVGSDRAWRIALKPVPDATGRRNTYLDIEQRRALVNAAADEIRPFCEALCYLPVRPGAMATLKVMDFDSRRNELTVVYDKKHGQRRILLPQSTAALFANASRGKKAAQPIFTRQNGLPWDKDSWKKPVKAAVAAAGLPDETVLYTLRHSVITDLVQSGLDLLTIAQISGTSVTMIEKHYGHFRQQRAAKALESLTL